MTASALSRDSRERAEETAVCLGPFAEESWSRPEFNRERAGHLDVSRFLSHLRAEIVSSAQVAYLRTSPTVEA